MRKWLPVVALLVIAAVALAAGPLAANTASVKGAALDAKKAPASVVRHHQLTPRNNLDEVLINEGFESGSMPPAGWTRTVTNNGNPFYTWYPASTNVAGPTPYEGNDCAGIDYAEDVTLQNEWLITPVINFSAHTGAPVCRFVWMMSYYWGVTPNDNYDLELKISTDGGTTWVATPLWTETAQGVFTSWEWYETEVSLAAYAAQTNVKLGFRYYGQDGAQAGLDAFVVETMNPAGILTGTVTNQTSGLPQGGVAVRVVGTTLEATTGTNGQYNFPRVDVGTYDVIFSRNFFVPDTESVTITANQTTTLNVQLVPTGTGVTAIDEDFEDVTPGQLPTGWTQQDIDAGIAPLFANGPSQWQVVNNTSYPGHNSSRHVANAYNSPAIANDDWLILPQQTLAAPIAFSFWACSQSATWLENFEVRVSTTGTTPANFNRLIATITDLPSTWTYFSYDLSTVANQPFYIGIHYNSTDEFMLKIDDVLLEGAQAVASGVLRGIVTNAVTSSPLLGVNVSVLTTTLSANTSATGAYTIPAVPVGTYSIRYTKTNFDTLIINVVNINENDTTLQNAQMQPLSAVGDPVMAPNKFAFYGNYPNPFNPGTEFRFALDRSGEVELMLYNIAGQEVARVFNGSLNAGEHTVGFNAANLPSGLYIARLSAAGHTASHKVMLLK